MPTNPNGALGSLDYKKEEMRTLAIKSRYVAPRSDLGTELLQEFLRDSKKKKTNEKAVAQGTPQPQKLDESTPTVPPALSKVNPSPEATAAALKMMACTASYVPKELPMPSFSLGFTDLSQEEALS
ncbi:hypothetical protein Ahy_A03g013719 [Arachis hypogaea]|uniref:Uncharacterized protein n=1 Tax=Arachis hypogaea TaxID=3818 RepID=A0A445DW94_ARAHY|nr:hypothetical protein Ahy_A03g013719 [Arachis hypogaea]